jgi:hypothetical protein
VSDIYLYTYDHDNVLDCATKSLVKILFRHLEIQYGSRNPGDDEQRFDPFGQRPAEDCFGLNADAFDSVDENDNTICNSERCRGLGE